MESYCSLCTFKVPQGENNLILCTLDTIHRLFFVTRLIINKINKVQWVDFKLENVLVSLHSLKTMGLGPFGASSPLFLRNGELLGHSPIHKYPFYCFETISVKHCLSISELDDFLEALYTHGISAYLKSGYFPDETELARIFIQSTSIYTRPFRCTKRDELIRSNKRVIEYILAT